MVLVATFLLDPRSPLRKQRKRLKKTYQLVEEILGASSTDTILKRITETLPSILGVTRVQLYIYNRGAKTLDTVAGQARRAGFDSSGFSSRKSVGRRRGLLSLPHVAGDSGYRP